MSVLKRGAGVVVGLAVAGGVYFVRDRPNQCMIDTYNELVQIESTWVDTVNADKQLDAKDLEPTEEARTKLEALDVGLCTDDYKSLWKRHIDAVKKVHDKLEAMANASDDDFAAADEALGKAMDDRMAIMKELNAYLDGRSGIELED